MIPPLVQILIHNLIVAASSSFAPFPLAFVFPSSLVVPNLCFSSLLVDALSLAPLPLFLSLVSSALSWPIIISARYPLPTTIYSIREDWGWLPLIILFRYSSLYFCVAFIFTTVFASAGFRVFGYPFVFRSVPATYTSLIPLLTDT